MTLLQKIKLISLNLFKAQMATFIIKLLVSDRYEIPY